MPSRHGSKEIDARMRRRTEITVETRQLLIVRRRGGSICAWCKGCLSEVRMITASEAAAFAGVSPRTIYRWIEEAKLHFSEDPGGSLWICANSLGESERH